LLQQDQFVSKFQVEGIPPTNNSDFTCQKTNINDLSCGLRTWEQVYFVLSQSTHLTDRQTDIWLMANMRLHCCSV